MPDYISISPPFLFECQNCPTPCDGISVPHFDFEKDVAFAEQIEGELIARFNKQYPHYIAAKTSREGYPDLEIADREERTQPFLMLEIKAQTRTFMAVARCMPACGLLPSETVALNLSDLLRYFDIKQKYPTTPMYILWCLLNRPCITPVGRRRWFYADIEHLRKIYENEKNKRRFRRKSGVGDVVDGRHKGVTVNYHFSLNELTEGFPPLKK